MAPDEMDLQDMRSDSPTAMDAVDLTGSSPEPEQRPRSALHQQRLPAHFKSERRSHESGSRSNKHEFKASGANHRDSRSQARSVAPQDLARIIDTSSPTAIKNVLLELCKMSPALSGAVARGLASKSTYAQHLIKKHQRAPRPSASTSLRTQAARPSASTYVKNERYSEEDVCENVKKSLAPQLAAQTSSSNNGRPSQSTSSARNSRAFGAQSGTSIKWHQPVCLDDSDSDLDTYIPTEFPLSGELKVPTPRLRQAASQIASPRSPPLSDVSSRTLQADPAGAAVKRCTQCDEDIDDEEEGGICFYHQGPKNRINNVSSCSSCEKPWKDLGCVLGSHVTT